MVCQSFSQTLIRKGFPCSFGEFLQWVSKGVFVEAVDESQDIPGGTLEVFFTDAACPMDDPFSEIHSLEDTWP